MDIIIPLAIGAGLLLFAGRPEAKKNETWTDGGFTPDPRTNPGKLAKGLDVANRTMATAVVLTSVYQSAQAAFKKNPTPENKKKVDLAAAAVKKARASADKAKKQKPEKKGDLQSTDRKTERETKVILAAVKILTGKGFPNSESKLGEEFRKISAMSPAALKAMGQQMGLTAAEMRSLAAAAAIVVKRKSTN